jgi:transcriptional regulator with XRE-family HTH domain
MIDAAQIRAARALLDISQEELAKLASVSAATVKRLEAARQLRGAAESIWKIESTLERLGIEFIPADNKKGSGLRIRRRPSKRADR